MHIFLTGGAGYIGGTTCAALLQAGHQVTVYDNLSRGHRTAIPAGAHFIQGDLEDRAALAAALASANFEAVLHFAALIEAGESMQQPARYFRNNTSGSLNLIEAAINAGSLKFVFSSTAAVYASSPDPLTEDSQLQPANVYGETKLMIERMLHWHNQVHGLRYAALRYFNACGALPGRGEAHQPETHLIPRLMQVALGQQAAFSIHGTDYATPDGTCIRDYIHIADLAAAHLMALQALGTQPALTYNLGSGHGYSVRQLLERARAITGRTIPTVEAPRRAGDAARLVAQPDKIGRELGWHAQHSDLDGILTTAWDWHRSHPHGYPAA